MIICHQYIFIKSIWQPSCNIFLINYLLSILSLQQYFIYMYIGINVVSIILLILVDSKTFHNNIIIYYILFAD